MAKYPGEASNFIHKEKQSFNAIIAEECGCFSNPLFLIVTADDYGYDERRDEGIIECFTKGIVTRASLLVNGASANTTAVQLAKENNMPLGIHLNLTEGEPVADGNWTLKGNNSRFLRGKFGLRKALSCGEIDMAHVKDEIDAQIKTFVQLVGYLPNHVDGHQHIHVLPGIREVIADVMQTYSLGQIRIPLEDCRDEFNCKQEFFNKVFQDAKVAMEVYTKSGIRFPEKFIGIYLMGKNMSVDRVVHAIERLKKESEPRSGPLFCELMVHPGKSCINGVGGCGNGPDGFACSADREYEAEILKDPELGKIICKKGISLMS